MGSINFGQKLNVKDLNNEFWQQRFADPQALAEMIRERGISFVELSLNENSDIDELLEISAILKREGLFISLHPHFESALAPEIFSKEKIVAMEDILLAIQEIGNITTVPVQCVFHGGKALMAPWFIPHEIAIKNACSFFLWLDNIVTERYENIIPLCETQEPINVENSGAHRLGDTWAGSLELIHDTSVGICWDFGHTFRSTYLGKQNSIPDEHFLARVAHVHAHDAIMTEHGIEDHFPIGDHLVSWKEYCSELARHYYDETILIDVNPDKYESLNNFLDGIQNTVELLQVYF